MLGSTFALPHPTDSISWPMFRCDAARTGTRTGSGPAARSPRVRWRFRTGGPLQGSPVTLGGRVVFGSQDGQIYCLDTRTGLEVWRVPVEHEFAASTPTCTADSVFYTALDQEIHALDLAAGCERCRCHCACYCGGIRWVCRRRARSSGQ